MHRDTTCLFARNARDCLSPKHNRGKQWKVLLLAAFESVLPESHGELCCSAARHLLGLLLSQPHIPSSILPSRARTHSLAVGVTPSAQKFVSRSDLGKDGGSYCFQLPPRINDFLLSHAQKRDIRHPLALCKAVICCRPMTQLKAAINSFHIKETPLLEYVQSGSLSHPSAS